MTPRACRVVAQVLVVGWLAAAVVASPALAAVGGGSGAVSESSVRNATGLLLEKAQFWYEKGQLPVALDFYTRVLTLQPDNTDALAGASRVAFDQGHDAQAHEFLERLRKVSPDDPFLAAFDTLKRRTPEDAATLLEARTLAVQGKKEAALAKYRRLFKGDVVPVDLAADYYPLYISSLPDESLEADRAITEINALADKNPKDITLQLAAAWSDILTSGSRADGIARMRALAKIPAMRERATTLWRLALVWEGSSFEAQEHLETYLQDHPSDPELDAKREQYVHDLPDISVRARWKAGDAIGARDYKTAEEQLNIALNRDPDDAESLAMMALVHKLDGKGRDWRGLYQRAVKLMPDTEPQFREMLGLDAEKAVNDKYHQVGVLTEAGRYAEAEALLRSLIGNQRNPGSYLQLATIQGKAGKTDAAMASLQIALAGDPANPAANEAMAEFYIEQKRFNEARPLLARAEAGYQASKDEHGLKVVRAAKADLMRIDALAATDPATRERGLRDALAVDPASWWIKLELARQVRDSGRADEAKALMDDAYRLANTPGALDTKEGQDALQVAFTWAQEVNDRSRADALVRLVPSGKRSASMDRFLADLAFKKQVRELGSDGDARAIDTLLQLAGKPDPSGERGTEIGVALIRLQDVVSLRRALAISLDATNPPTARQRISYAGVLMQANQFGAARDVVAPLARAQLNPTEREALENLKDGLAISELDPLLQQNRAAEAQKLVARRLAVHPDSMALQAAYARTQIAMGNVVQPLATLSALLDKEPGNLSVRMAAIEANMKLQNFGQAADLAEDGMRLYPRNPYLVIQAAVAARARGRKSEALGLMVRARQMLSAAWEPDAASALD